jgi:hypothetical protein
LTTDRDRTANSGDSGMCLGYAELTLVEPTQGEVGSFNEWYERDHALSFATAPGCFARRRFVATRDLKRRRFPLDGEVADPLDTGTFFAFYWIEKSRFIDTLRFAVADLPKLKEAGRMWGSSYRTHVSTAYYEYLGMSQIGPTPIPPELTLDYPYPGLMVLWLAARPGSDIREVALWCREVLDKKLQATGPISEVLDFVSVEYPPELRAVVAEFGLKDPPERLLRCYFLHEEPSQGSDELFAYIANDIDMNGDASVQLCAGFLPTVPGTAKYLDLLW